MKEITLNAVIENIEAVTDFVNVELERLGCPVKAQFQIDVAIDELFGNIAHYAYSPETGKATVRVEVEDEPLSVIISFIDNGRPFNPLEKVDPDTTLSLEDRKEGVSKMSSSIFGEAFWGVIKLRFRKIRPAK